MSAIVHATVEQALNRVLALDPYTRSRLERYHGRIIALQLRGPQIALYLVPGPGIVAVYEHIEDEADCTISGSPLTFARLAGGADAVDSLFEGQLSITGDTELGHHFGRLLGQMHIDWEELLSQVSGDVIAHQLGTQVRRGLSWLRDSRQRLASDVSEYLEEELRAIPTRFELEEWLQGVDKTRDDVERLSARIQRLQQLQNGSSDR